jgi:hypothetical protein
MFFFNSQKEREIERGSVAFVIKPLDCYEQLEYLAIMDGTEPAAEKVVKAAKLVLKNNVKDIKGLSNENGEPVDYKSVPADDFIKGLTVGMCNDILDAVAETGRLPEDVKKKSSPPPESSGGA